MPGQNVYVATDTDEGGKGLAVYDLAIDDHEVGLERRGGVRLDDGPSFLAAHPDRELLYVVHEVEAGAVTALRRGRDGSLTRVNRVPSGAGGPCHCSVHPSGDFLFVAHYTGGAVSVLPIEDDGRLAPPIDTLVHEGASVHPERQTGPHPHSITPGPRGRYLYVPDLGTDEVVVYEFDEGSLDPAGTTPTRAGAGPRHLAFHPDRHVAAVTNELDSTVSTFAWTPGTGELSRADTVSTVPPDHDADNYPGEIAVHPSGRWAFVSNRGHDSIAVFAVDGDDGSLERVGLESTGGTWPRHFTHDATGELLLVGNRRSDTVVTFRFDEETGSIQHAGLTVEVPGPRCLCCLPAREDE